MLEFREIDRHNFRDILKLSTTESQKFFVATNAYSLSQAYAQPECVPLALYDGDTPVGFTMYGLDVEDTEYWIYRLMIDQRHQSKGYGRQALAMVLLPAPVGPVMRKMPSSESSLSVKSMTHSPARLFRLRKRSCSIFMNLPLSSPSPCPAALQGRLRDVPRDPAGPSGSTRAGGRVPLP